MGMKHNLNAACHDLYLVSKGNSVPSYLPHYMVTACEPWVLSENSPRAPRAYTWVTISMLLTQQNSMKIALTMVTDARRQHLSLKNSCWNSSQSTVKGFRVVCFGCWDAEIWIMVNFIGWCNYTKKKVCTCSTCSPPKKTLTENNFEIVRRTETNSQTKSIKAGHLVRPLASAPPGDVYACYGPHKSLTPIKLHIKMISHTFCSCTPTVSFYSLLTFTHFTNSHAESYFLLLSYGKQSSLMLFLPMKCEPYFTLYFLSWELDVTMNGSWRVWSFL